MVGNANSMQYELLSKSVTVKFLLKRTLEDLGNNLVWVNGWGRGMELPHIEVFCSVRDTFLRFVKFYHLRAGEKYLDPG